MSDYYLLKKDSALWKQKNVCGRMHIKMYSTEMECEDGRQMELGQDCVLVVVNLRWCYHRFSFV
jgi:hypothetical protein